LTVKNNTNGGYDIAVFDLLGRRLYLQSLTGAENSIELGTVATGMYLVKISSSAGQVVEKIILR
jgi:hypothetical protein